MPSSPSYNCSNVVKLCEVCQKPLQLNNSRDLERKRFCSNSCRGKGTWLDREFQQETCLVCGSAFTPRNHAQKYCSQKCNSSKQLERSYRMLNENPEKYFQHALYKRGREALTVDFMLDLLEKQGGLCAITGQKLTFIKVPGNGRINTNASIDQIVAGGGYTEDNVQIICDTVNRMKSDMTEKELLFWCRAILEG